MLFSPFKIRELELRNRFVFLPHFTALGHIDGQPSDDLAAYHEERARGGVGLIVIESQAVHPTGKMARRFINAWDPAVIPNLRKITGAAHAHGAKIFSQLTHGGHTSLEHPPHIMWAPTQMPEPSSHFNTKAIDEDDIRVVIEGFAVSARNAAEAGFDGIEIKVGHDGLLRSFASPFFNRRVDRYGGSLENRMRLSLEVLEAVKKSTENIIPVGVRICLDEFTPFGYDLEYGLQMATMLERSGLVDYFNSDAGSFSSYWMEIPPAAVERSDFRRLCAELKLALDHEAWGSGFRATQTPDFLALNPNALVPVIVDGELVLWESNTICRYLAGREGRDDLLPTAPAARARVEQWMDWQATELNTAWRYAFMALVRQSPAHADAQAVAASVADWSRLMTLLDARLARTGAYAAGPQFTLADIVLGVSANRWFMTPMPRPHLPAVDAWFERLSERPGFLAHGRNGTP